MIKFSTTIKKFDAKGEKTGWTYIDIPAELAQHLKPGNKLSFLVKGKLDQLSIKGVSLLPMGGGDFIMPLKADVRKKLGKAKGAVLNVQLETDEQVYKLNTDLIDCMQDEAAAIKNFNKLPSSHQKYFSKWIDAAKTDTTKAKRIALTIEAMRLNLSYNEMMQRNRQDKLM